MTLTTARADVTRAVARLRSLGVKVSTIIGHDPTGGEYHYGLRLPDGIPAHLIGEAVPENRTTHGSVTTPFPFLSDGHHLSVHVERPPAFLSRVNDVQARTARAVEARHLLDTVADRVVTYTTSKEG